MAINKLSEVASKENNFIQSYAEKVLKEKVLVEIDNSRNIIKLNLKEFNKQDIVIKNRIVVLCIKQVVGNVQGLEKVHINDIVKMCENNIGNKFLTPNKNIKVFVEKGIVTFSKNS